MKRFWPPSLINSMFVPRGPLNWNRCQFSSLERRFLTVGTAQMRPDQPLKDILRKMTGFIEDAGNRGVDVVVFPEIAVPGYIPEKIVRTSNEEVESAERTIRESCKEHSVAAVFGRPYHCTSTDRSYNTATLIGSEGEVVGRQHKLQLVDPDLGWSVPGTDLNVFKLLGVPVCAIICHDKRYPELVRLPVLAGARLVFYMSAEQWHDDLPICAPRDGERWDDERLTNEISVYRAQIQARAVENGVWIVKSNAAACREDPMQGSHGCSSVIDPTGAVKVEAGVFDEEMVTFKIDLREANATYAQRSLRPEFALSDWWQQGLQIVKVH